jgi:6,7-dimethyl-8-ribityllumazine synthase
MPAPMPKVIEGQLQAGGLRFAIVASRFNAFVVEPLVAGALDAIARTGGDPDAVTLVRCPGAWELPQVVRALVAAGEVDAVIALGAVIRGSTPTLTTSPARRQGPGPDRRQARRAGQLRRADHRHHRAGHRARRHKAGNKGFDAAMVAIETADLLRRIRGSGRTSKK